MEKCTISELAKAAKGRLTGNSDIVITDITTDSRRGGAGSMFVALVGDKFDGNDFAADFLLRGSAAVTNREITPPEGKAVIVVEDTGKALLDIAEFYRGKFDLPITAVTGSVGKTSTKDMIASVLSKGFNTLKTEYNYNNEIGLPLMTFRLDRSHEAAVLEMGMNHSGEISRLTAVAQPQIAVITNIGTAHIGNLGSQQNILKAKLEVLEKLRPDGVVVLNGDDKILYSLKGQLPHTVIYYGISNLKADVIATDIVLGNDKSKFRVNINGEPCAFEINTIGQHHIYNALAAIIAGIYHKMDVADIQSGVGDFTPDGIRQNIVKAGKITVIDDCYNASLDSMESSLMVLSQVGGVNRTVAVLGDMLEQGDFAKKAHREVGDLVARTQVQKLVTVGKDARYIAEQAAQGGVEDLTSFDDNEAAARHLLATVQDGDTILFKASRGMKLEEISIQLKTKFGE